MVALTNHSMLKDPSLVLNAVNCLETKTGWVKRIGRDPRNMAGSETPLGHTLSLIMEGLARSVQDFRPSDIDVAEFLEYVDREQEHYNRGTSLATPTFHPSITRPTLAYAAGKGLAEEQQQRILTEIIGPEYC